MLKVFIEDEDISYVPKQEEKNGLPATDADLIALAEKFSDFEIPFGVFLQAIAIAAYDTASAYRYADNYLSYVKNAHKKKNRRHRKPREPYFNT